MSAVLLKYTSIYGYSFMYCNCISVFRSTHLKMSFKIDVFKKFVIFTENSFVGVSNTDVFKKIL